MPRETGSPLPGASLPALARAKAYVAADARSRIVGSEKEKMTGGARVALLARSVLEEPELPEE